MRWESIGHTYDGFWCTVIFDTPKEPGVLKRYDGKIQCPGLAVVPILTNPHSTSFLLPPAYATVIVHTPELKENTW